MTGVGIIGLGSIGRIHASAIGQVDGLQVVARSGGDADGPTPRSTAQQVIDHAEVDVVAICTPASQHAVWARAAIAAGKHVVVEKPLAVTAAEAAELVELAEAAGVLLVPVAQRRLERQNTALHEALTRGDLGRPVLAEVAVHWLRDDSYYAAVPWRQQAGEGAGSLANQGLHALDLALWWLGDVASVSAHQATLGHDLPFEDTTVATLQFTSGALAVVSTSTATPPGLPARLTVATDRGSFELTHTTVTRWTFDDIAAPPSDEAVVSGANDPLAIGHSGHAVLWAAVEAAVRGAGDPPIAAADGARTVAVIEAIEQAATTGRTVRL